ncbi:hypothetical protein S40288_10417 [Stachybotrys chartarum IBT 40288]|nr:hypothetical protein S40288_10417 [Stachybotrys chartarum IBT 40288]
MAYKEAATVPCVFMTSMYPLNCLARTKKGNRVPVHFATGGDGISAIQLSQEVCAEVASMY